MTATPEPDFAPSAEQDATAWADRSAFGTMRGIPWWGAILLAVLFTAAGSVIDQVMNSQPGIIFAACYVVGCLLAVGLVRRSRLFAPMVQPPLVLAVVMPVVVLAVGTSVPDGASTRTLVLAVARAVIPSFPAMAVTTLVVIGIGLLRMFVLERKDKPAPDDDQQLAEARTRKAARPPKDVAKAGGANGEPTGPPPERGSGPRPAKGARPGRPDGGNRDGEPARPAPGRGKPGAPKTAAAEQKDRPPQRGQAQGSQGGRGPNQPAKQGGRGPNQRGGPPPGSRQPGQQGGQQGAQPPGRGRGTGRPAPGRGSGPRPNPPGRGKTPPRQPEGEPPRRPRPPRRDG